MMPTDVVPDSRATAAESFSRARRAVRLSREIEYWSRVMVRLLRRDGHSEREIAERTGLARNTVRAALNKLSPGQWTAADEARKPRTYMLVYPHPQQHERDALEYVGRK